jgi:hypothetical protein
MQSLDAGPVTGAGGGGQVTGTGGVLGAGGSSGDLSPPCPAGVKNMGACTTEPACHNSCGPLKSGVKPCTCQVADGRWSCPTCEYPSGGDYSCYLVTAATSACPADPTDPSGTGLPMAGTPCAIPTCTPCGSATVPGYRDAASTPKLGFCVCSASDGTGTYSCAQAQEWPPQ